MKSAKSFQNTMSYNNCQIIVFLPSDGLMLYNSAHKSKQYLNEQKDICVILNNQKCFQSYKTKYVISSKTRRLYIRPL